VPNICSSRPWWLADISSNGDAQNTSRSCSQDQHLLEMLKVGPDACAGARRA
jgi:hypothetical protein